MTQRDLAIKDLEANGYMFDHHGGKHDVYRNQANQKIPLKRHDFDEDDRRYINKEIRLNKRRLFQ